MSALLVVTLAVAAGCSSDGAPCGPESALVERVAADGTLRLESGERIRLAGVDLAVLGREPDAPGETAVSFLACALEGREVALEYEPSCVPTDRSLPAYAWRCDEQINTALVVRGLARRDASAAPDELRYGAELEVAEADACEHGRGLWRP